MINLTIIQVWLISLHFYVECWITTSLSTILSGEWMVLSRANLQNGLVQYTIYQNWNGQITIMAKIRSIKFLLLKFLARGAYPSCLTFSLTIDCLEKRENFCHWAFACLYISILAIVPFGVHATSNKLMEIHEVQERRKQTRHRYYFNS